MIDNETMGTGPTAAVIQIGAVLFDTKNKVILNPRFERTISFDSAVALGCSVDKNTIEWWKRQSEQAQRAVMENPQPISKVMNEFVEWFRSLGRIEGVWSHGASFDIPQLEFIMRRLEINCPWRYFNVRDTRTLHWLAGLPKPTRKTAHTALADAIAQADDVLQSLRLLGK
jgi:DNA polymerase III epsilon subunit-like protein